MTDREVREVSRESLELSRRELGQGAAVAATGAAAMALASSASAQASNEISGTVTDSSGGVGGATVVAVPHDSSLDPLVTTTDSDGTYQFTQSDLYDGTNIYHVIARDGTQSDPRRAQENYPFIAAEGAKTIPTAGLLHHYDWSEESSPGTIADLEGTADLTATGDPTLGGSISGMQAGRTDGVDDWWRGQFSSTVTQPFRTFIVGQFRTVDNQNAYAIVDGVSRNNLLYNDTGASSAGEWRINHGTGLNTGDPPSDTNAHLFEDYANGSASELYIDGSQVFSGNAGSNDLDGLTVGARADNTMVAEVEVGEIAIYDPTASGYSAQDVRDYLNSKWGIY